MTRSWHDLMHGSPDRLGRLACLVANALTMSRQALSRQFSPDSRRSIFDECGYPRELTAQHYQDMYDRDAIAARVVEVLPRESWQVSPSVFEQEDAEVVTPFEEAWDNLSRQLRGEGGYYQDETGSAVWEYLRRADELSGVGRYGLVLLGLDDGREYREPARAFRPGSAADPARLLFLRAFPESLADVTRFEQDPRSPRFGQPLEYSVTFNDPREGEAGGAGRNAGTLPVHWTRVIHLADNLASSEVFGVPRMRPVYNHLYDLQKVYGANGESYWRNAFLKLFLETQPGLGGDVIIDSDTLRDDFEKMLNSAQQWMVLQGLTPRSIPPAVADPTPHVAAHIDAVCIKLGVPKRVFCGSERGELASSQDDAAWNDRLRYRQKYHITPRIIVPFVDRLINLGVLPQPEGYSVWWPDLTSQTEGEKSDNALKKTQALAAYTTSGAEKTMALVDYLTRVLGLDEAEAQAVAENAEAVRARARAEEMERQENEARRTAAFAQVNGTARQSGQAFGGNGNG